MQVKDLCIVCANNYKTSDKWHDFYYLDTGNLTQNHISELQHFQAERDLPSRAKQKVSKGSILYSSVRPNQLHYGYFEEEIPNLLASTGFIILLPNENLVNGKFLYYFLTQHWVTNKLQSLAQSNVSAYPSISKDDILSIEIDLPDRKTQDEIA
jgi:type I restriction enzyme S subunit